MLVVDADALRAVDRLDLAQQVVLHRLLALDRQDVLRHQRPVDERLARDDVVAPLHAQVLALRHEVLAIEAALALDDDRALAAALLAEVDGAVDLGEHRRVLRTSRLEQLGHARQTARDVLGALDLARRLREQFAGRDLFAVLDEQVGLLRHLDDGQTVLVLVDDDEVRVQVALVLDHHLALDLRLGVALGAERLALEDVLVADRARDLGEDRVVV